MMPPALLHPVWWYPSREHDLQARPLSRARAQDPSRIGKRTGPKLGNPDRGISGRAKPQHLL